MDAISHGLGPSQDQSSLLDLMHAAKVSFTPSTMALQRCQGTGKDWRKATNAYRIQGVYAANLLSLAGHGAAKISICLLLKRLGRQGNYLLCSRILLGMVMAWMGASILAVALSCSPQHQMATKQHCGNIVRWLCAPLVPSD